VLAGASVAVGCLIGTWKRERDGRANEAAAGMFWWRAVGALRDEAIEHAARDGSRARRPHLKSRRHELGRYAEKLSENIVNPVGELLVAVHDIDAHRDLSSLSSRGSRDLFARPTPVRRRRATEFHFAAP